MLQSSLYAFRYYNEWKASRGAPSAFQTEVECTGGHGDSACSVDASAVGKQVFDSECRQFWCCAMRTSISRHDTDDSDSSLDAVVHGIVSVHHDL